MIGSKQIFSQKTKTSNQSQEKAKIRISWTAAKHKAVSFPNFASEQLFWPGRPWGIFSHTPWGVQILVQIFGGRGQKFWCRFFPGSRFSVQIPQDQDHSHRAGIRPRNTSRGPRADKYGYGADIWRKNLQIEKQYGKNMNKTLRKPRDNSRQNRCKCNSKSYLFLEDFQTKQATQPDQILIFHRQKSRQTSDIFSLEILSSIHLILGKSRIVTQFADGSNAEKNRLGATQPRQKRAKLNRETQIYFLGIILGKSVDKFLEVNFYIGSCFKTEEKKGHTVYGGCFETDWKKGHTIHLLKRFSIHLKKFKNF